MNRYPAQPERLVNLPSEQDLTGVSALVRAAATPLREIAPAARQRMRSRLRRTLEGRGSAFHPRWRVALPLVFTLAVGGVVGAATHSVIIGRLSPNKSTAPVAEPPATTKPRAPRKISVRTPAEADVPPEEVAPIDANPIATHLVAVPARSRPAPVRLARRDSMPLPGPPPEVPVTPAPPSPIAVEQALLGDILKLLRTEHNPKAALALLDEHAKRFPETVLAPEAWMFRAEALLSIGRKAEALSVLDGLPLASMPSRNERLVLRGELRSVAGRWQEARADFEMPLSVLKSGVDARSREVVERALWGRPIWPHTCASSPRGDSPHRPRRCCEVRHESTRIQAFAGLALHGRIRPCQSGNEPGGPELWRLS